VIFIGGKTGSFTGTHMSAGTVIVKGHLGPRAGASMTRGVILCLGTSSELLPSFVYDVTATFEFIRIYLKTLKEQEQLPIETHEFTGPYLKFSGDRAEKEAKGEIFLLASTNQNHIQSTE
jgi:formylmethanofuran dehydrogenase subunit C